jgi:hypothetical protein
MENTCSVDPELNILTNSVRLEDGVFKIRRSIFTVSITSGAQLETCTWRDKKRLKMR